MPPEVEEDETGLRFGDGAGGYDDVGGGRARRRTRARRRRDQPYRRPGEIHREEATAAKMHEPAPWRSAASSAGWLCSRAGLDVTREASAEETPASAAEKAPARVHATTGRPVLAAYATHRLPVLPLAPNTTTGAADGWATKRRGGSGTAPGASSADAAGTNARREGAGARRAPRRA